MNVILVDIIILYFNRGRIGIIRIISISKIKNINVIKKNWIENGRRGLDIGLNPHSNGVIFFRFFWIIFVNIMLIMIITVGIIMNTAFIVTIVKIIYILLKFFNWKLNVIIIYTIYIYIYKCGYGFIFFCYLLIVSSVDCNI